MKKKFLILTLCFTLIFSSINFKRSYADGGVLSLPILATVSALAVGTGVAINNIDDMYDLGKMFVDYVSNYNSMTLNTLGALFNSCVSLSPNKLVTVKGEFLDLVKGFFDSTFLNASSDLKYYSSIPLHPNSMSVVGDIAFEKYLIKFDGNYAKIYADGVLQSSPIVKGCTLFKLLSVSSNSFVVSFYGTSKHGTLGWINQTVQGTLVAGLTFPYSGGYSWDNANDKINENNELPLPIPGNLDNLLGKTKDDFWSNTSDLTQDGAFDISDTLNPSISIDKSQSITNSATGGGTVEGEKPNLPALPSWGSGLDFSPITQGVLTEKFPFCLAKDVKDIISVFDVSSRNLKDPIFEIPLLGEEFILDFTEFKLWFDIVKFFVLIGFIISLIVLTRGIIG